MPTTSPVRVSGSSPARCATPKSVSLAGARRAKLGGDPLGVGDDHVLGLDVAVDDPALVGVQQRVREVQAHAQHVAIRQRAGGLELRERAALDQL